MNRPNHRVVVTGAGILTALGRSWDENYEGFKSGRREFTEVTRFDTQRQRTRLAAQVLDADLFTSLAGNKSSNGDRAYSMLFLTASEALCRSGVSRNSGLACILGTTSGGMTMGEEFLRLASLSGSSRKGQATRVLQYLAPHQAAKLGEDLGLTGISRIVSNACSSGANAIGQGWNLIRSGRCKSALVGGYDALSHLVFAGFDSLQALSTTTCRPFSATRDGLMLGEGAGMLVLEDYDSAMGRGAAILAEICGYAASTDLHHLTQPHPEGQAAFESMSRACAIAGIQPSEIDYINAHGTGTIHNDSAEAAAIARWAGDCIGQMRVSSTKAGIGHLLGAAGAVEAVVCLMAIHGQWIPPQASEDPADPLFQFNLVRAPITGKIGKVMSNSFGFGGANATLVFGGLD